MNYVSLSIAEFKDLKNANHLIIDTRPADEFLNGFVPGSVNLPLDGDITDWAGRLLATDTQIILVTEPEQETKSLAELNKAGLLQIAGYLDGGFAAWQQGDEETDLVIGVEADELIMDIPFDENLLVIDVRFPDEFEAAHLKDAINLPLDEMTDIAELANFEENQNLYLHSMGTNRASTAASLMKRQGYHNLRVIEGGFVAISRESKAEIVKASSK
jgi:rhodanese-related sulfurtransferase